jgi:hypothetical protein
MLFKANHAYLMYLILQRQLSHLNCHKLWGEPTKNTIHSYILFPQEHVCIAQKWVVYQESAALATALSLCFVSVGTRLLSHCPAMDVFCGSMISGFMSQYCYSLFIISSPD